MHDLAAPAGAESGTSRRMESSRRSIAAGGGEHRRDVLDHASRCRARRRPGGRGAGCPDRNRCSGMSTPSTFFGAERRARRAPPQTLESMPPERPSTTPRLRSRCSTCSRMRRGDARRSRAAASRRSAVARTNARRLGEWRRVGGTLFIPQPPASARRSARRLILPVSVFGSASRNSTSFGTMKSSRCCAQWRITSSLGERRRPARARRRP